jgi:hypothetical protein
MRQCKTSSQSQHANSAIVSQHKAVRLRAQWATGNLYVPPDQAIFQTMWKTTDRAVFKHNTVLYFAFFDVAVVIN